MKISRLLLIMCLLLGLGINVNAKGVSKCKHVILIGADGFTSEVIRNNPGRYAHLEALMKEGYWTLESRSVLPSSSAINWATVLMGAGSEMHGYTTWNSQKPDLEPITTNKWGMFPFIFGITREQMPNAETGVIYSWNGIGYLFEKPAVNFDKQCKEGDDAEVAQGAMQYIVNKKPNLFFIYFSQPDEAGHKYGWCSKEYNAACDTVDAYIGEIVKTIKSNFDMNETAILFTSDHGGLPAKSHGGKTMLEMQTPFIVVGAKLPKDYKMNYSVMRYDIAPTMAQLLRLKTPDAWRGKSVIDR